MAPQIRPIPGDRPSNCHHASIITWRLRIVNLIACQEPPYIAGQIFGVRPFQPGVLMMMAKRERASARGTTAASWAERHEAAYRAAEQEIAGLRPGEAILYHEGNLVIDIANDPAVAGRAAAFRDATEADRGVIAQRRLGFERYQYIFWRAHRERG